MDEYRDYLARMAATLKSWSPKPVAECTV